MDYAIPIGIVVYLALLILVVVSVAYKTTRLIDLIQEIASNWRHEKVPVEGLGLRAQTPSNE
jgi:hypothetical protein